MIQIADMETLKYADYIPSVKITFADGDVVNVAKTGIGLKGTKMSYSGGNKVPVGSAIGRTLILELLNSDGRFNSRDFFGAVVELQLTYDANHIITIRDLVCSEPPTSLGNYIDIKCVDNMWRTEKPYESQLVFPASVGAIWRDLCTICGLETTLTSHPVFSLSVAEPITGKTCREVFAAIAAMAGGNAMVDSEGRVTVRQLVLPTESTGTDHILDNWIKLTTDLHDVQITGVSCKRTNASGASETVLAGSNGYVLELADSPLIKGHEADVCQTIYTAVGNIGVRKYSGDAYFYPMIEPGDTVKVIDRDGTAYYSITTDVSWSLGGKTTVKNAMTAPSVAGKGSSDPAVKAIIEARELVAKERTEREQAMVSLQSALAQASGMYATNVTQEDGSTIYYLHDKSTLETSFNIIKMTSEAIAMSTDGGETYPYGFQITGDMVVRLLSAAGVSASWIDTGALTVRDPNGVVVFSCDVDAGTVFIDGVTIDDGTITVGVNDSTYTTVISPNSMSIEGKKHSIFEANLDGVRIPSLLMLDDGAAVQAGDYVIERDGNDMVIEQRPLWVTQPSLAKASVISAAGNPRIDRDNITTQIINPTGGWTVLLISIPIISDDTVAEDLTLTAAGKYKYYGTNNNQVTGSMPSAMFQSWTGSGTSSYGIPGTDSPVLAQNISSGWSGSAGVYKWAIWLSPYTNTPNYDAMFNLSFTLHRKNKTSVRYDWYLHAISTLDKVARIRASDRTVEIGPRIAFDYIGLGQASAMFKKFYDMIYPVGTCFLVSDQTTANNMKTLLQGRTAWMYTWGDDVSYDSSPVTWAVYSTTIDGSVFYRVKRDA